MRVLALLALACIAAGPSPKPAAVPPAAAKVPPAASAPSPNLTPAQPTLAVALGAEGGKEASRLLLKPYADASATRLADTQWDGTPDSIPRTHADLLLVDGAALLAGCRAQTLAHLDWSRLNRDRYFPIAAGDCGAGAYIAATVLAWDHDKLQADPNWGDFWDVARHPGRRGLARKAHGNLEIALLADGVAPGDIYRTLRTPEGIDRAFRKLDQLKPYIEWWDGSVTAAQLLSTGRVLLTSAPAAGLLAAGMAAHHHFGIQPVGQLVQAASWAIPRDAANAAAALIAIVVAGDIARQAQFAEATGFGPALRDALDLMPAAARTQSPAADLSGALTIDDGFWLDNRDRLEARFAAWLAKP